MYDYLAAIAAWGPSRAINESSWIFAVVQAFHLVSLGFLAGSILMVDLRMLGRGFSQQPLSAVARDARPWLELAGGDALHELLADPPAERLAADRLEHHRRLDGGHGAMVSAGRWSDGLAG